jgi:hypothetical protein
LFIQHKRIYDKYSIGEHEMDIIRVDVPTFLRLLELAREDVKQDADLHDIAEIVTRLSQEGPVTMEKYNEIVAFMKQQGREDEVDAIRRLGGV